MSTVIVNKIDFESTSNNRISYASNTITIGAGGSDVISINSTALSVSNIVPASVTYILSNGTIVANTLTVSSNANIQVYGQINFNGVVTPTAINVNTSAFAPGANNTIIRFSANTSNNTQLSLYGMVAGVNGQVVILSNIGTKNVIIENESQSEATAGNRFSLPASIVLNGYQSTSLIYDGTAARWKPIDYNGNFYFKQLLEKGFIAGGFTLPTPVSVTANTERVSYPSETTAVVTGANLSAARSVAGSAGNQIKGFFSGGQTPTTTAISNRTTYSSETTAAVPGANLSQARFLAAAAGNACKGFFLGGGPTTLATADRTTYSTETTAAVPGANLSQAKAQLGATGNACKGFFSGGLAPACSVSATANKTTYSTETTAAVAGANLTQARFKLSGIGNACKGFLSAGFTSTASPFPIGNTSDRVTFATETTAAVAGAVLSQARVEYATTGDTTKGFFVGGSTGTGPFGDCGAVKTADRTTYATETTAAVPGANLTQAKVAAGGL